ncbi:hypothetical protein PV10_05616 [Exophiala mesophila]|uniref:Uncharacterized protein n=1 Tax=Exophiala mesophila TaxID=212818 RepID=A0A0D1XSF2_EXOME|nr:uncharacterized protein PV10_05616 [Exophiala mesophila]KIV91026.1 hypothetical protein PV10_05616 [Exophiala mesophila]
MGIVVFPALIPDIEKVYDVYFAAFEGEEMARLIMKILFPGGITEEFRKAHTAATLAYWHKSSTQYTLKAVDMETGQIIGMLLGDVHLLGRTEEERKFAGAPWLEGEERVRAEKVLKPLWEMREKLWGDRPHMYCHVIGVDPKNQGRHAGAALIKWGSEQASSANLPIYFESSPSTAKLYERLGCQRIKETIVHSAEVLGTDHDIEVPLMVVMPKCAKGMTFDEWRERGYPAWDTITDVEKPKAQPDLKAPVKVAQLPATA